MEGSDITTLIPVEVRIIKDGRIMNEDKWREEKV